MQFPCLHRVSASSLRAPTGLRAWSFSGLATGAAIHRSLLWAQHLPSKKGFQKRTLGGLRFHENAPKSRRTPVFRILGGMTSLFGVLWGNCPQTLQRTLLKVSWIFRPTDSCKRRGSGRHSCQLLGGGGQFPPPSKDLDR